MQDIENEEINENMKSLYKVTFQRHVVCRKLSTVFFTQIPVWFELFPSWVKGRCTNLSFWWIWPLDNFIVSSCRQQDLYRILKAYTIYRPDEGYCQAQAPVAAVLLMHMPAEVRGWTIDFTWARPVGTQEDELTSQDAVCCHAWK